MRQTTRIGADRTLELLEQEVGRSLAEVETPVAVVDLDLLEANLRELQTYADAHGIELWPHTKTHKSPEIGMLQLQLELGATGLTVAKTGEALVFRDAGATRLLVHYPPIGEAKWERLARLAAEGVDLTVAVDGPYAAQGLSAALARMGTTATLLVELDVGLHRTGQTTAAGALALAQGLSALPRSASPSPTCCRRTACSTPRCATSTSATSHRTGSATRTSRSSRSAGSSSGSSSASASSS
jgi:D-serine deaminase-like pyridoxal phosphate-dependent protein